jgi:hypothetical protein
VQNVLNSSDAFSFLGAAFLNNPTHDIMEYSESLLEADKPRLKLMN